MNLMTINKPLTVAMKITSHYEKSVSHVLFSSSGIDLTFSNLSHKWYLDSEGDNVAPYTNIKYAC